MDLQANGVSLSPTVVRCIGRDFPNMSLVCLYSWFIMNPKQRLNIWSQQTLRSIKSHLCPESTAVRRESHSLGGCKGRKGGGSGGTSAQASVHYSSFLSESMRPFYLQDVSKPAEHNRRHFESTRVIQSQHSGKCLFRMETGIGPQAMGLGVGQHYGLWPPKLRHQILPNCQIHILIEFGGGAFGSYISGFSSCSGNIPGKQFKKVWGLVSIVNLTQHRVTGKGNLHVGSSWRNWVMDMSVEGLSSC